MTLLLVFTLPDTLLLYDYFSSKTLLWGLTIRGPGPFALRESEGPIRGELWPKPYNAEHEPIFWEAAEDSLVLGRSMIPPE